MGNANHAGNRDQSQTIQAIKGWPLLFHQTHSTNVQLSPDQRRAKRLETFCNGICFSNRPVSIGEQVILRFVEVSTSWSGVMRFGFTSHDPSSINAGGLPRYACPDLTNKYGYWAKALPERFALQDNILCFHVCRSGNVMYAVNGEDKGLFFGGVVTGQPLWALIDIYGNTTAIEYIDPCLILSSPLKDVNSPTLTSMSNFFISLDAQQLGRPVQGHARAGQLLPTNRQSLRHGRGQAPEHQANNQNLHQYNQQQHRSLLAGDRPSVRCSGLPDMTLDPTTVLPPVRHYRNLTPLPFHVVAGKNVRLSSDRLVAARIPDEYCNGYVFSSRPLKPGEKIVVQVLSLDNVFTGGIAFGMTSCDISQLKPADFPDDADLLLDRPEYWVVNKDVCSNPAVGDELSFHFTTEGEIKYGKNGFHITTLMHVDKEVKLWAFFDVYGQTQRIKVLGVATSSSSSSSSSLPSSGNSNRQQHQQLQHQANFFDESLPRDLVLSDLVLSHGNLRSSSLASETIGFPQQRGESSDGAPPRPPPPLKKTSIPQAEHIPALPPKQARTMQGIAAVPDSFSRNSPSSSGSVCSQPLSPSRVVSSFAPPSSSLLDVSSLASHQRLDFSLPNPASPDSSFEALQKEQAQSRFHSTVRPQRPAIAVPKPAAPLRSSATFRTLNKRSENAPHSLADCPPSTSVPTLVDRIIALAQSGAVPCQAPPPVPSPRTFPDETNSSMSEPTARRNLQKLPSTSVGGSVDRDGISVDALSKTSDVSMSECRDNGECSVCFERAPDCALYTCGHMCMCYDCALALKESRDAQCPICRQPIRDVIKIYRS